jgi:hypothetical protein
MLCKTATLESASVRLISLIQERRDELVDVDKFKSALRARYAIRVLRRKH